LIKATSIKPFSSKSHNKAIIIIKDVRHLKNITLMAMPAKVAGLTGITEIQDHKPTCT